MKLTKSKLQQIIREELEKLSVEEGSMGTHPAGQKLADKQRMCKYAELQYEEGRTDLAGSPGSDGDMKMAMAQDMMAFYGCPKAKMRDEE